MRILVTAESIAPSTGGGRVGILGLCKGLVNKGHQVTLLTTNADGKETLDVPLEVATFQEGVEVFFYPVQISILGNMISFSMAQAFKNHISQSDIVLIHSLYRFTSTVAAHFCRKFAVPYILRPHGTLDPFLFYRRRRLLKMLFIKLFEIRNFKFAAATQYSSQLEIEVARSLFPVPSNSLIIPEGIDTQDFVRLPTQGKFRERYPETKNKTLVLFLGRFHPKKGLELLIESFARVADRCPDAHLVLAGTGDPNYTKQIVQMLRDAMLIHRSTVTGPLDNELKLAALVDSDLFALPSHGENFGLAVVEAMACGLPVLISDKVGIWQEVAKAEAGLVTHCDLNKITKAMEKLINEPGLRVMLGLNGKKLVEAKFTIDRMAEKMELEYQKLCVNI